jgi:hypothetical protein
MKSIFKWFIIHVISPLFPFFIEGFLRFAVIQKMSINTFSASTLAMSQGLLFILIAQSISHHQFLIPNNDDADDKELWTRICMGVAIFCFALFGVCVFTDALIIDRKIDILEIVFFVKALVFVFSVIFTVLTIPIQATFKLRMK